jgi:hypothetical protein
VPSGPLAKRNGLSYLNRTTTTAHQEVFILLRCGINSSVFESTCNAVSSKTLNIS